MFRSVRNALDIVGHLIVRGSVRKHAIVPNRAACGKGRGVRRNPPGRTVQFATRIKPEYHRKAKLIAARDGITLAELFEKGVDAYEREQTRS